MSTLYQAWEFSGFQAFCAQNQKSWDQPKFEKKKPFTYNIGVHGWIMDLMKRHFSIKKAVSGFLLVFDSHSDYMFQMSTLRAGGAGSSTSAVDELSSTFRWVEQSCPGFTDTFLTEVLDQLASHTLGDRELRSAKDHLLMPASSSSPSSTLHR